MAYYCKYHKGVGPAHRLFKEFVIGSFLSKWGIIHAPVGIIVVSQKHVPLELGIQQNCFIAPCFGSQLLENVADLNLANEGILKHANLKQHLKRDLLKLAFFDIWTCNEDRHSSNYNLLIRSVEPNGFEIIPIDHEACFNHGNLHDELYPVTYEDNLIYSTLFKQIFKPKEFRNQELLDNLRQELYLCSLECKKSVSSILQKIPLEWNFDLSEKEHHLNTFLLNDQWFDTSWRVFLEFLQLFSNPK